MRILYLTHKPMFPALDGGCIAMQRILEGLELNKYYVHHICISTEKHPFYPEKYEPVNGRVESQFISTKINPFKALSALFNNKSYNIDRFHSKKLEDRLRTLLQEDKFDIILLESIYTASYLDIIKKNSSAKIIIRTHNVEFKLWEQKAQIEKNPLKKWYLEKLASQLRNFEIKVLNEIDSILTISNEDLLAFELSGVKTKMHYLPVAIAEIGQKTDYTPTSFFHIGSMNWQPNIEAVEILLSKVFPEIKKRIPDATLKLAGSFMPDKLNKLNLEGVEIVGFVKDTSDFFRNEGIFLCPVISGSGVRIKIIEAMSLGVPTITTSKGVEGLNIKGGIIVEDEWNRFIERAIELYFDQEKRKTLGLTARKEIFEERSISSVAKKMNDIFSDK